MNKFSFSHLKMIIFGLFMFIVFGVLAILFFGPCHRDINTSDEEKEEIPAVIYLSNTDVSDTDISGTDISPTDTSETDAEK